ncbi:hypothetical protein L207DRAFT_640297 [Hyaloscypha variabilis F]|uniref:Uncharacterized protein n=1 Tax=Hyaloscypha variabilis (strain UAMH 11265 / GT02V1 / F) TaxID=1149755 RepID=A0A2J6R0C9_HYAVF|nr:hypothetical protein L207DRAFT_640297 [Hyaloscypha variabilis F]
MSERNKKNHGDVTSSSWASLGNANDGAGIGWNPSGHGTPGAYGTSGYVSLNAGSYGPSQKDFTAAGLVQAPTQMGLPNSVGQPWAESGGVNDEAGNWHGYVTAAGYGQTGYGANEGSLKDFTTSGVMQSPMQAQLGLQNLGGMNDPKWGYSGSVNDEAGGWYGYVTPGAGYGQSGYVMPGYGTNGGGSLKDFTTSEVMQSPMQVQLGLQNSGGPAWQYSYAGNDSPGGGSY